MPDHPLMTLLNFNEADLHTNRQGRLSEKQHANLAKDEKWRKGCASIGGVFLVLVGLLGILIAYVFVSEMRYESPYGSLMFGGAFGCFWPLLWGGIGVASLRRAFVNLQVTVKKIEGPINIVKAIRESYDSASGTTSTYSVYELFVGGRMFEVNAGLAGVMMPGDEYAVYYADFQKVEQAQVLSAELLRKNTGPYTPSPQSMDDPEVIEFLKKGQKLQAIKAHRTIHQSTLEEAQAIVEEMSVRLGY